MRKRERNEQKQDILFMKDFGSLEMESSDQWQTFSFYFKLIAKQIEQKCTFDQFQVELIDDSFEIWNNKNTLNYYLIFVFIVSQRSDAARGGATRIILFFCFFTFNFNLSIFMLSSIFWYSVVSQSHSSPVFLVFFIIYSVPPCIHHTNKLPIFLFFSFFEWNNYNLSQNMNEQWTYIYKQHTFALAM